MNIQTTLPSKLISGELNELALFAGAGGGILGSNLLGWNTVCAVERDAYAAQVLAQRQNDGILKPFPIWSDIASFDGKPWKRIVDVISGGFPCQDISAAGKGAGIDGERSGLWAEMARIISEVGPEFVFVENSPMLVGRGLARVISDLAQMGYVMQWARFSASNFGAPHQRDRLWIVGHSRSERFDEGRENHSKHDRQVFSSTGKHPQPLANTNRIRLEKKWLSERLDSEEPNFGGNGAHVANTNSFGCEQMEQRVISGTPSKGPASSIKHGSITRGWKWWSVEPRLGRVANGVAYRVDRLKAIGNGQVPIVAKSAFKFLASIDVRE